MRMQAVVVVGLVALVGCTTIPRGPNVTVLKGPYKTFEEYQRDAAYCRHYAEQQLGVAEGQAETEAVAKGAVVAGLLGAGLGAAIGAISGSPGLGAAVGGTAGVATGAAGGMHRGDRAAMTLQVRYDQQFSICMDSFQNYVPGLSVPRR